MTLPFGYNGKILHVNLTRGEVHSEDLPEEVYRLYVGGGLLGTYLLLRDTKPGLDPVLCVFNAPGDKLQMVRQKVRRTLRLPNGDET